MAWLKELREECFAAWPTNAPPAKLNQGFNAGGAVIYSLNGANIYEISQTTASLSASLPTKDREDRIVLEFGVHQSNPQSGPVRATLNSASLDQLAPKKATQVMRRFMLLGETVDSMRVWDIVRAIEAIHASKEFGRLPIRIEAEGDMAVNALYASLFAPVHELVLTNLPQSHMNGPAYLNVLRILDIPQAVAMASERCRVELRGANDADWKFATDTARVAGFEKNLRLTP
jgi:hypothetical protein